MKGSQAVRQGWKAYSQGNLALAEIEFSKAVDQCSEAAYALLQRGLFWLRQDRFSEACSTFEAACAKEPQNPAPLFFLALARELAGDAALADQHLENLQQLCPRHQGLVSLRLLTEIRRGDPLPSLHLLGFGQTPDKAKESWRSLAAGLGIGDPAWLPPDLSSSPYLMGPILLEIERRLIAREIPSLEHRAEDLIAFLDNLNQSPPKRKLADEIRAVGKSWKSGPKLRKGRQTLERAMGIESTEEQKQELGKAIVLLEEGHALDAFAFRTTYHLGEAHLFSAKSFPGAPYLRDSLERAESYFLSSASQDGINPYVLFYLALIQQLLGRPQTAIDCYAKATEKFTKLPEAHYGAGQCYLLLGNLQSARDFLLQAVNSDLTLARDRLNLFANLLQSEGPEAFSGQLPALPLEHDAKAALEATSAEPARGETVLDQPGDGALRVGADASAAGHGEVDPGKTETGL